MKTLKFKSLILIALTCITMSIPVFSQNSYIPSESNLQARKEFSDSKFGIFIHWGIYSMFGQGEWYMNNASIDCHEYAKAASGFYPARFNAKEWVSAIKEAGAKYICFTT